jgi:hypothetical protein
MLEVPCWEFGKCLELLMENFNRTDSTDDLDPEAERQLCQLAVKDTGIAAVFVLGFPLSARPFGAALASVNTFSKGSRTVRYLPALPCRLRAMGRTV